IDVLLAASERAAELASPLYPGDYEILPDPIAPAFHPGAPRHGLIVAEWTSESRSVVRSLIKLAAEQEKIELTLAWDRRSRRPMRPYVPARARGRVHVEGMDGEEARAKLLSAATVVVTAPGGAARLAWEARACGAAVVSPGDGQGLHFAADQPPLAA